MSPLLIILTQTVLRDILRHFRQFPDFQSRHIFVQIIHIGLTDLQVGEGKKGCLDTLGLKSWLSLALKDCKGFIKFSLNFHQNSAYSFS